MWREQALGAAAASRIGLAQVMLQAPTHTGSLSPTELFTVLPTLLPLPTPPRNEANTRQPFLLWASFFLSKGGGMASPLDVSQRKLGKDLAILRLRLGLGLRVRIREPLFTKAPGTSRFPPGRSVHEYATWVEGFSPFAMIWVQVGEG